jgi:hypothetical protein
MARPLKGVGDTQEKCVIHGELLIDHLFGIKVAPPHQLFCNVWAIVPGLLTFPKLEFMLS